MQNGQYVRAAQQSKHLKTRKFLLVVQYWNGDKDAAEELCSLIADLERVRNRDADILLFGRSDATEPSHDIMTKLRAKFDKVHFLRCRRAAPNSGNAHPYAPNQLFYDMVALFSQVQPWPDDYFAFVNLETDCVPTRPGWINELIEGWRQADAHGKACIGHIHDEVKLHMNGVGVYAIDMWARVGSNKLGGGSPQVPYDIRHAASILPLAVDSPLFHFEYRRPTISAEELFRERKGGLVPAIWHGVKDGTARAAVKARHITFTEQREVSRQTVFTFYEPSDYTNEAECAALLDVWREGWKSRGWNPVVLSMRDAAKSGRFQGVGEAITHHPRIGPASAQVNRFMRWVALARMGGGLMVDYDLIPGGFTPHDLPNESLIIFDGRTGALCGLRLDRDASHKLLDAIENYRATETDVVDGRPCVTDATIVKTLFGSNVDKIAASSFGDGNAWKDGALVHFPQSALNEHKPGSRKSEVVDSYLRAK